jgi:DNA-binding response OmpR family regulator
MSRQILVVDDSLTVRMNLTETLTAAGFDTTACASLSEARAALSSMRFVLVVLDILLPDGDGIDLLKEIRDTAENALTPVMLLSTESEVRDRIRGLSTGADEFIGKPYDPHYLVARARELLRAVETAREPGRQTVLVIDDSRPFARK